MHKHHRPHARRPQAARARGFSLAELMIAITIGLLILAGMTTLFVNNSQAQAEVEKGNRQIENGRFGISLLSNDLRNAGFYGEFDPSAMATPGVLPSPCEDTLAGIKAAMALHVQGVNDASASSTGLGCLADLVTGSDVLVVRHARTCVLGTANCGAVGDTGPFLQASLCNNTDELDSGQITKYYGLETTSTALTLHSRNCTSLAPVRRYLTYIYFLAANDEEGDGIPTLKRAELQMSGTAIVFSIVSLVEGVEKMHFQYGIDSLPAALPDGVADSFSADPGTPAAWRNVVSVKINLLARNLEKTTGYKDEKSYTLGTDAGGAELVIAASQDQYKRHVFKALAALSNPVGRRMP